ncbi:MAG: hypothetical protein WA945_05485 [Arcobacteraceae bacterium]
MRKLIIIALFLNTMLYANQVMSPKSYNILMEAQKHIEENKIKEAQVLLNQLLEEDNDYAKSYAYQYLANISLQEGDYEITKKYYAIIVKLNALEKDRIDEIKLSLSKIYLSLDEFDKSIQLSSELLKDSKVEKKDIYETFIFAYYYTQKFKKSIEFAHKFNTLETEKKENIYQILYSSYIELKEYKNAIVTLEVMTRQWYNKENYWLQLASLYQETQAYKKALATIELSYKKDVLDPKKHTRFYVNLLFQNELYQKSSLVLENALKKGYIKEDKKMFEMLISSYVNAKEFEKAIEKIKHSKFQKKMKYKEILANLYYAKHDYKSTIKVLTQENKHKHKHKKKREKLNPDMHILLALSYYELENIEQTKVHLQKAYHTKKKKRAIQLAEALRIDLK